MKHKPKDLSFGNTYLSGNTNLIKIDVQRQSLRLKKAMRILKRTVEHPLIQRTLEKTRCLRRNICQPEKKGKIYIQRVNYKQKCQERNQILCKFMFMGRGGFEIAPKQ